MFFDSDVRSDVGSAPQLHAQQNSKHKQQTPPKQQQQTNDLQSSNGDEMADGASHLRIGK
jgi:hypothetical protein